MPSAVYGRRRITIRTYRPPRCYRSCCRFLDQLVRIQIPAHVRLRVEGRVWRGAFISRLLSHWYAKLDAAFVERGHQPAFVHRLVDASDDDFE